MCSMLNLFIICLEVYFQSITVVHILQAAHARIAAPKTLLGLPELTLGVIPGSGGMNSCNVLFFIHWPVSRSRQFSVFTN